MDTPYTAVTTELRHAIANLIDYWDEMNNGNDPGLAALARCISQIKNAQPHPGGQLGDDIAYVINPPHRATRIDCGDVLERLRHLTRPTVEGQTEQLSIEQLGIEQLGVEKL